MPALRSVRIALDRQPDNRTVLTLTLESETDPLTEDELADLRQLFAEATLTHSDITAVLKITTKQ